MSKSSVQEYADRLCDFYGVPRKTVPNYETIREVAKAVLPEPQLKMWLAREQDELVDLRRNFNMKPYDKFSNLTVDDL